MAGLIKQKAAAESSWRAGGAAQFLVNVHNTVRNPKLEIRNPNQPATENRE
jgi:hypothetical protein